LHVPIGKLHTDRWIPVDEQIRELHARIRLLRLEHASSASSSFLLPRPREYGAAYQVLLRVLIGAAKQAGCSRRVTPHQLRHTYATDMLRSGASLPAVMHLLGHKDIRMTLRYIQVTQKDLQREYHRARQSIGALHAIPELPAAHGKPGSDAGITSVFQSLLAIRYLLEMYRRRLRDQKPRRAIARLADRLLKINRELAKVVNAQKSS
jgi:Phage integrase family